MSPTHCKPLLHCSSCMSTWHLRTRRSAQHPLGSSQHASVQHRFSIWVREGCTNTEESSQQCPSHHPCSERKRSACSTRVNFQHQQLVLGLRVFWLKDYENAMANTMVGDHDLFLPSKDNRHSIDCLIWKEFTQQPRATDFDYCSSVALMSEGNSTFSQSPESQLSCAKRAKPKPSSWERQGARTVPILTLGQQLAASRKERIATWVS